MGNILKNSNKSKENNKFSGIVICPNTYMLNCKIENMIEYTENIVKFNYFLEPIEDVEFNEIIYEEKFASNILCFRHLSLELYTFVITQIHEYLNKKYWKKYIFITDKWNLGDVYQNMNIKVLGLDHDSMHIGFKLLNDLFNQWEFCLTNYTIENPKVKQNLYDTIIYFDY